MREVQLYALKIRKHDTYSSYRMQNVLASTEYEARKSAIDDLDETEWIDEAIPVGPRYEVKDA